MEKPHLDLYELRCVSGYWYVATPYSKYPDGIEAAFQDAAKAAAYLIKNGVHVFCPIAHTHPIAIHGNIDPMSHVIWMPNDKPFMEGACGLVIVTMNGYLDSYGIQMERDYFYYSYKPIQYLPWSQVKEGTCNALATPASTS